MNFLRFTALLVCMTAISIHAQSTIPMSVKEIAPDFGIRPQFLDDTIHITRYLDSLNGSNQAMADTCVTLNSRLMAMSNVLLYDYRHTNDTVWIDATHYLEDYSQYSHNIDSLSRFIIQRAHFYLDREHQHQEAAQISSLNLRRDTIDRNHRTILNGCEGIGVADKNRKKDLKDLYYAYLSVYNRYDFSMKRNDARYIASLDEFSQFQQHLIDNFLSNDNYAARINNFTNTLKVRCGRDHSEVLRAYQRAFRTTVPPISFSTLREYYDYVATLQEIVNIQNSYLTVVDLREQITATNKRIYSLYSPRFHDVAKTYQEVVDNLNTIPSFNTLPNAQIFINNLQEFTQVQDSYLNDYLRLSAIQNHGDTIRRRCTPRYSEVAKAYKLLNDNNPMRPTYRTLDDATRFSREMGRFERLQRQYDTIIDQLQFIDYLKDSISKGWMQHIVVHNGLQTVTKQYVFTPTFIDFAGGHEFIQQLKEFSDVEQRCLYAIDLNNQYKSLDATLQPEMKRFRTLSKTYSQMEKQYLTIKAINHLTELYIYCQQLEAFISVQNIFMEIVQSPDAQNIDAQLKKNKDASQIENILGL